MKFLTLILLYFCTLVLPREAWGAVTFDATDDSIADTVSSLNYSLTVGACANPIVIVDVAWSSNTAETISALTIGGSSATLIDNVFLVDVGNRWLASYRRIGVTPSTSNAIAITFSNAIGTVTSAARSYCGVDQVTPLGTAAQGAGDSAGPATATASSASGELVISMAHVRNETFTGVYGGTQTERYNVEPGFTISGTDKAGAGSVQMDHNISATSQWGIIAVPLKPSAPSAARRRVVVIQ